MKVILPVAGKGTRLRPHTHTKPKSLVQVAGKAVIDYILEGLFILKDIDEFIFIVDENGSEVEKYIKDSYPSLKVEYIPQRERLGPAHAVYLAKERILPGEDILIVFNDTIFIADLYVIYTLKNRYDGLIFSKEVEDYKRFGVNVVKDGYIVDMVEKPDKPISRLAQVGLYYIKDGSLLMSYIEKAIKENKKVKGEFYLPPIFKMMIEDGFKFGAPEIDVWLDCGKPETLLQTNRYLLKKNNKIFGELENVSIISPVYIGKGSKIKNVSVAEGCIIERAILQDCIINQGSHIKDIVIRDSLIGEHAFISGKSEKLNIGDDSVLEIT